MESNNLSITSPLKVAPLELKNRNIMASLTQGGVGLILSEATLISHQGTEWPYAPGIWSEEQIKVTDAVHATGTPIFMQLWHLGRVLHPDMPEQKKANKPVFGASALAARGGKFRDPPPESQPTELEDLHSANGYLVNQFLDSTSNHRTDKWGGSVENRTRFGLEILKELVSVWGSDRVGIKISPCGGYNDMGMPLDDTLATYSYYIEKIDTMKLAYIQIVRYVEELELVFDGVKRSTKHDVVSSYRPLIHNSKLFLNGGIDPSSSLVSNLISSGQIDAVVFGRAWITHPDLEKRVEAGQPLDNPARVPTYYTVKDGDLAIGYTDYPVFNGVKVEA